ncbi:Exosome complex component csl4 [Glycine soja]|nr:Exosome complex component csl4 [Glycine soja]
MEEEKETVMVTPGEVLGRTSDIKDGNTRLTVEVTGHKSHGPVPQPGSVVIARVTKVMTRSASADIMCVGPKSVREKFTGIIRQQDVRATEIDKVDMHLSFHPGDIVRSLVLSLGDARAYFLSTAKNELGVVSAESIAGEILLIFWELNPYKWLWL